jgi:glutamate decarboxylase
MTNLLSVRLHIGLKVRADNLTVAGRLRSKGWIVPACASPSDTAMPISCRADTMAPDAQKMKLLRVVVREDLSRMRANDLLRDCSSVRAHTGMLTRRAQ